MAKSIEPKTKKLILFWHRRDLRLNDNAGLFAAFKQAQESDNNIAIQPIFIFDKKILDLLKDNDKRLPFLVKTVSSLKEEYKKLGSDLWIFYDYPQNVFEKLISNQFLSQRLFSVFTNVDYEPYARDRDKSIFEALKTKGVLYKHFKDQVVFEKSEILTDGQKPYSVFTPYKKKWLSQLSDFMLKSYPTELYFKFLNPFSNNEFTNFELSLQSLGFKDSGLKYPSRELSEKMLKEYSEKRNFPELQGATSLLGLHLRFGTISVRELVREAQKHSDVWLSELIWREFFMQILWHYPHIEKTSFRAEYEKVEWRKSEEDFMRWSQGQTGYPIVDAGIRELLMTGHMHNRVRMIVASFFTKHLLHHWLQGERFFAEHLLDFELSANNGNWQWAAGTGCDAAPYFRIFNPATQIEKFDPNWNYIKRWVPEVNSSSYSKPMVEHKFARERALAAFSKALKKN